MQFEVIFETFSPGTTISTCRSTLGVAGTPCGIVAGEVASLTLVAMDRFNNLRKFRPSFGADQFEVNLQLLTDLLYVDDPIEATVSPAAYIHGADTTAEYQAVTRCIPTEQALYIHAAD